MSEERPTEPNDQLPAPHGGSELSSAEPYHTYYPPAYAYEASGTGEGATDWRHILGVLWQRKWWILVGLAVGIAGGVGATRFLHPTYEVNSSLLLAANDDKQGPIRPEDVLQGEGWADILKSFAVLEPVVRDLNLELHPVDPADPDPGLFGNYALADRPIPGDYELERGSKGGYRLIREGSNTIETGSVGDSIGRKFGFLWQPSAKDLATAGKTVRFRVVTPRQAAFEIRSKLNVVFDRDARIITAHLQWDDPREGANILNAIVQNFIQTATDLRNRKITEVKNILQEQNEYAAQRLDRAELALENFKVQTATLPTEEKQSPIPGLKMNTNPLFSSYFDKRVDADQLQGQISQLQSILDSASGGDSLNILALQQIAATAQDPTLVQALKELQDKQADRRSLLYQYTEQYPPVQDLTSRIQTLKEQTIPGEVANLVAEMRQQLSSLKQDVQSQAEQLKSIPPRSIEEAKLQREVTMAEKLHNDLLSRLQAAALAEKTALPDLQVLDRAVPLNRPSSNDAPRLILFASLAGLGLAVGGVLLFDHLDRRIRYPEQVTRNLGLPVLGVVPRLDQRSGNGATAHIAVEAFRGIRTQLQHAEPAGLGTILVTSAAPRDGKSMVAANLAISYASAGHRTILLDADTRRGRAHRMFQLSSKPGLMDYLLGRAALDDVQQRTGVDHLTLVARGGTSGFQSELLEGEKMERLLSTLRKRFDVVVVDGPPLAAGADTLVLSQQATKVIFVVRAGETDQQMALTRLRMMGNVDIPIVGAVLNAVPDNAPYYRYYANYYYAQAEITG